MLSKYNIKKLSASERGKTVVVGLSGGVDSAVSAYILKWQGYKVVGLFMRNWRENNEDGACTAEADFEDVKRICEVIDIPYYSIDFSEQYARQVFDEFINGLKRGVTPNPDVLCNREIKFGPFLDFACKLGADYIATGHYARHEIRDINGEPRHLLLKGIDASKDQSYFLCAVSEVQLARVLFPLGMLKKTQVREIATIAKIPVAKKKDSTGICFIGERKFREFIKNYVGNKPGDIKTLDGTFIGRHDGLMYYTLGQRRGLGIGADKENADRWFVVRKDLDKNELIISNGECPEMFSRTAIIKNFFFRQRPNTDKFKANVKLRYRQPDQTCQVTLKHVGNNMQVTIVCDEPQRSVTAGQWAVLYDGDLCLGGGEIDGAY